MSIFGFQEGRNLTITETGAFSIDGHQAVLEIIKGFEQRVTDGETIANITSNVKVTGTGKTPFRIYVFNMQANFTTGTYTFAFLEVAPNADEATNLP